jgi:site-specific DNA recombinase
MEKKRIVAAYCRVSTLEQKKRGYGIDIQMRDIEKYAEIFGLDVEG